MMKKLDLSQIVGIMANLGVLAGIAFLAAELSQNTDAMRSQTVQSLQSEMREIFDFPEGFVQTSSKDSEDLTEDERFVRTAFFTRVMRINENQWYQHEQGYLDTELFQAYQQHLRITLGNKDYIQLWDIRKELGFFHPGFVRYVDSYIAMNPPFSTAEIR